MNAPLVIIYKVLLQEKPKNVRDSAGRWRTDMLVKRPAFENTTSLCGKHSMNETTRKRCYVEEGVFVG